MLWLRDGVHEGYDTPANPSLPARPPCRVLFLAWLPYTPGSLLEDGSFQSAGSGGGGATAEAAQQSMQSAKGAGSLLPGSSQSPIAICS